MKKRIKLDKVKAYLPRRLWHWLMQSLYIIRQVLLQTYRDGFVLAGNFAFMSLLAIFPFFIVAASVGSMFGRTHNGYIMVEAFLQTLPPSVAQLLGSSVLSVLEARSGHVIWLAVLVGLWTTASLIKSIRDMIHRAYGISERRPFWQLRLGSIAMIIGSVVLAMFSFSIQVVLSGIEEIVGVILPFADVALLVFAWSQVLTTVILFGALFMIFRLLTPRKYRGGDYSIWPGPLFVALWWMGATALLPIIIRNFSNYDLTYGSMAGVMISLIFFFIIGLGMVFGAELNAVLAQDMGDFESEDLRQNITQDTIL